jgi:hypothetical protein
MCQSKSNPHPDTDELFNSWTDCRRLMHEATVREATGAPPRSYSDVAPFAYFNMLGDASVLRDIDGREQMILPDVYAANFGEDTFPFPFDGMPFDHVVAEVQRTADS